MFVNEQRRQELRRGRIHDLLTEIQRCRAVPKGVGDGAARRPYQLQSDLRPL
jgi:hypothetical protein